jgi:hypothetical protein
MSFYVAPLFRLIPDPDTRGMELVLAEQTVPNELL